MSTVPYIFAGNTGNIPLSELDANFANVKALVDSANIVTNRSQPAITSVGTLSSLSVSGNITSSYLYGNGSQLTGVVATSIGTLPSLSVTGNVTASYYIGNGSQLTGIASATSSNANALVGNTLSSNVTTSTLTSVGTLSSLSVSGNVYSNGNIAMVSDLPRNVYIANTAPGNTAGNIGDIWYQTY